jgi:nucleoside-diphosphate-sugar epimerase
VTGGAGYIGSVLIPEILKKHNVRVLDNLTYGYYGILPHLGNPNFEFIKGDVRNIEDIKKSLVDIDFIVHLAAIVGYPACKAKPDLAYDVNYIATKNLVKLSSVPIIFASTGSNYGNVENVCSEETLLNPLTEYGLSKSKAEKEIQKSSNYIIYRFSTGFGLSPRLRLDLLINDFLFKAMNDRELIIYEKDYWRSFIHVKDMVQSLIFAVEKFEEMNREIYNVGSENLCLTKEEVALKIKTYVDYYIKFAEFGKDPDQRNYQVSFKKINSLGFSTRYSLDYGIKEMINAFKFIRPMEEYYNNRVFR